MKIPVNKISNILADIEGCIQEWKNLISISFLSDEKKEKYLELLQKRVIEIFG